MSFRFTRPMAIAASLVGPGAFAIGGDGLDEAMKQIEALKAQMNAMEERHDTEMAALRSEQGEKWLTNARAVEIRELVKDVLADSETHTSLQSEAATAGYDKNFFIRSPDGNFTLKFIGLIQARYAYNYQPPENQIATATSPVMPSEYGFEMRRVELEFLGNVIDPSWEYKIKLSFNSNNAAVQTGAGVQTTSNAAVLEDAYIKKDLGNGWGLRVGQAKGFYDYEETVSGNALQFAERTILNSYFSTKFLQVAQLEYQNDNVKFAVNFNDGGGNRNVSAIGGATNVEWATMGRAEYKLFGGWKEVRDFTSWRGDAPAMMVGAAYNWQRGSSANAFNGNYIGNSDGVMISYTADVNYRCDGLSLFGAFLGNTFYDRPSSAGSVASLGAIIQGAYRVTDDIELMARFEYMNVSGGTSTVGGASSNSFTASSINAQRFNIYTVGVNYYIHKQKVKLTADAGYVVGAILFSNGVYGQNITGTDYRTDERSNASGQVVVRAQLQLVF